MSKLCKPIKYILRRPSRDIQQPLLEGAERPDNLKKEGKKKKMRDYEEQEQQTSIMTNTEVTGYLRLAGRRCALGEDALGWEFCLIRHWLLMERLREIEFI